MGINTPSYEPTDKELNHQIKEELTIKLNTKKSLGELEDDFETNKEMLAYKDRVIQKFESMLGEGKISGIVISKISEVFSNLNTNEDKYKVLNILEEVIELSETGEEINHEYIENILSDFDFVSPQIKMILGYIMLAVGMLLFSIEGFAASIVLGVGTYGILIGTSQSVDNRHSNTLDSINDIVPNISEDHFNRIQDAIDSSFQDKSDIILVISEELHKSYKDRILTDDEITKLEEAIKNI